VTIKEALDFGGRFLSGKGITNPRLDTELLLANLLGTDRIFLFAHSELPLSGQQAATLRIQLEKRAEGFPLQYLLGHQEFYGRDFQVSPAVLIPRPETELLVEVALELIRGWPEETRVLDLGTGSGCIAVSLACESACLHVTGVDISAAALEVARSNAERNGCSERLEFLQGDLLAPVIERREYFHLIVSNPPYVARGCGHLEPDVARYEPAAALFSGDTGLEIYDRILKEAGAVLRPNGLLVLELGFGLAEQVVEISRQSGWYVVLLRKDLAGIDRCLVLGRE
jgi:release factor glutamine methyltransferase